MAAASPLVSVIIPYYKQEAYIAETIQSVEQQTYSNIEIIVVDDGSPLPAQSVLGDRNNVLIFRTENQGCPAARNFGFRRSSGDFLLFLDSDDRLTSGAVEAHLQTLLTHSDSVLSFGSARIIDKSNKELRGPSICRPRSNYFPMFLEGNPIACPGAAMLRRDAFIEAGLFDESFRIVEDYRLYLKLTRMHRIVQLNSCVVEYRFHGGNASSNKEAMLKATLEALDCLEAEFPLTPIERTRLSHGRKRWQHMFRPQNTLAYKLKNLYYKVHAMKGVPLRSYLRSGS